MLVGETGLYCRTVPCFELLVLVLVGVGPRFLLLVVLLLV
jgi:hypothetical protein